jgi:hypothetical protein
MHDKATAELTFETVCQTRGHCVVTVRTHAGAKLFVVRLADSDTGGTSSRQSSADTEVMEARKWSPHSQNFGSRVT